jgi:lipopolysaccharide export system permease protein
MKIVDRYILRELIAAFIFGVLIFAIVLLAVLVLPKIMDAFNKTEMSFHDAIWFFIYSLPNVLLFTVAMAALLAVLMGFGRLSSESETVALHGAGVSMPRLAVPAIIFGLLVSLLALYLGQTVVPAANRASAQILNEVKSHQTDVLRDKVFVQDHGSMQYIIYAKVLNPANNTMRGVEIMTFNNGKPIVFDHAKEARQEGGGRTWLLLDGYYKTIGKENELPRLAVQYSRKEITNLGSTLEMVSSGKKNTEMSNTELRAQIKLLRSQKESPALFEVELYRRVAVPFAALVFALIGMPLGMRSHRRSSSLGVGLTIIIVFTYYVFSQWLGIIGEGGQMHPLAAAWVPNGIFALTGLVLIFTARK